MKEVTSQTGARGKTKPKKASLLKTSLKLFLAYCIVMVGLTQASRLSQWEEGTLINRADSANVSVYHGKISREFFTGNYHVADAAGSVQIVPTTEVKGVESRGSGITLAGILVGATGLILAALLFLFRPICHVFSQTD